MRAVLRQIASTLFVFWLAATLAFLLLRALPGDAIAAQLLNSGAGADVIAARRAQLGLNDALPLQYVRFIVGMLRGDLGASLLNGEPVLDVIVQRLPPTLALTLGALLVATLLGLALGMWGGLPLPGAALARALIALALSTPIYWTGTLVIYAASAFALNTPGALLPVWVLGCHAAAAIGRVLYTQVRVVLSADFVRTARAKGLPESLIYVRHVLRVALLPVISVIALQTGVLLTGTVITESLFVRPGIGRLLVERTLDQDYPVVQGIVILAAAAYTLVNVIADTVQRALDPRIRALP
ncbi:MAG: ABC transporter permease [Chloroflexi bacterium]|nr:ABC transporter permease [Chloroflexota bacterium]